MNLKEWQSSKVEKFRSEIKEAIRSGDEYDARFFTEEDIREITEEVEIEEFMEPVNFEESIELDEYFETDLNDTDCECPEDEDGCVCPEVFYDFIPDEYGEMMDLEFELYNPDVEDAGIEQYLKIKDAIFADDYDYFEADIQESVEDPLEDGMVAMGERGAAKVVFRRSKGQIVKRKRCPRGSRLKGNRCVPQGGTQKALNRRRGIKLKRAFKAMGTGAKKRAQVKRRITQRRVQGRARNYANT